MSLIDWGALGECSARSAGIRPALRHLPTDAAISTGLNPLQRVTESIGG